MKKLILPLLLITILLTSCEKKKTDSPVKEDIKDKEAVTIGEKPIASFNCGDFGLDIVKDSADYIEVKDCAWGMGWSCGKSFQIEKTEESPEGKIYSDGKIKILNNNGTWQLLAGHICASTPKEQEIQKIEEAKAMLQKLVAAREKCQQFHGRYPPDGSHTPQSYIDFCTGKKFIEFAGMMDKYSKTCPKDPSYTDCIVTEDWSYYISRNDLSAMREGKNYSISVQDNMPKEYICADGAFGGTLFPCEHLYGEEPEYKKNAPPPLSKKKEGELMSELDERAQKYDYCSVDEDCVQVLFNCSGASYGTFWPLKEINKAELENIGKDGAIIKILRKLNLVEDSQNCSYNGPPMDWKTNSHGLKCINGRCNS